MIIVEILLLLLVAGVCGAMARWVVGFGTGGFFTSIGLGVVGALIGSWLAQKFVLMEPLQLTLLGGRTFSVVWSIVGAALFAVAWGAVTGRKRSWKSW